MTKVLDLIELIIDSHVCILSDRYGLVEPKNPRDFAIYLRAARTDEDGFWLSLDGCCADVSAWASDIFTIALNESNASVINDSALAEHSLSNGQIDLSMLPEWSDGQLAELGGLIDSLESHPVLDEDAFCELERQLAEEEWNDWGRQDFTLSLLRALYPTLANTLIFKNHPRMLVHVDALDNFVQWCEDQPDICESIWAYETDYLFTTSVDEDEAEEWRVRYLLELHSQA